MLSAALIVLLVAACLGAGLAVRCLRPGAPALPLAAAGHGVVALGGLGLLLLALRGPPRGIATGTASFGTIAAALLGVAVLAGGAILLKRRRGRPPGSGLIGMHASVAIAGIVILAAYVLSG